MKTPSICFCPAVITLAVAGCAAFGTVHPVYAHTSAYAHTKSKKSTPAQPRYVAKGGYSFVIPAKWKPDDADISMERMGYDLVLEDTRVIASLRISTLRDTDATPDKIADHLREDVKEQTGTVLTVRDKAVTVSGEPGIIFETNNTRSEEPQTQMTLLTARNGVTSKVILICKTADRAKYSPIFDKVVETFQWQ